MSVEENTLKTEVKMTNKLTQSANNQNIAALCKDLKLPALHQEYLNQLANPQVAGLPFSNRLELMLLAEVNNRNEKRRARLLKESAIDDQMPSLERITFEPSRGLNESFIKELALFDWVRRENPLNLIITGAAGTGKTWLAKALGKKAIELDIRTYYIRMAQLTERLSFHHYHNEAAQFRNQINKKQLLIIDDFAMTPMNEQIRDDFLNLVDDRQFASSLVLISQRPFIEWYGYIGDAYHADSIMDRLKNSSHKINLKGRSLRELSSAAKEIKEMSSLGN